MNEQNEILPSDQYNIRWDIMRMRSILIAEYSVFQAHRQENKTIFTLKKIRSLECIIFIFTNLRFLGMNKIRKMKKNEEENIISYEEARNLYFKHKKNSERWNYEDLDKMHDFVLEACFVSGLAKPTIKLIDPTNEAVMN